MVAVPLLLAALPSSARGFHLTAHGGGSLQPGGGRAGWRARPRSLEHHVRTSHGPELTYMATPSCNRDHTILTSFWTVTCPAKALSVVKEDRRAAMWGQPAIPDTGRDVLHSECICPALQNCFRIGTVSHFSHTLSFSVEKMNTHWEEILTAHQRPSFWTEWSMGFLWGRVQWMILGKSITLPKSYDPRQVILPPKPILYQLNGDNRTIIPAS